MKKVISPVSVCIDGYFGGPNREIDWHIMDDELNAYIVEMLTAADVLIMGRRSYELMAGYWPSAPGGGPVKEKMNGLPRLVFSKTLTRVDWQNSSLLGCPRAGNDGYENGGENASGFREGANSSQARRFAKRRRISSLARICSGYAARDFRGR